MGETLFSHDLRILTCQRCGAPFEAGVEGGSFTCTFCHAENQLRRRDESADLSAAQAAAQATVSEAERHARLREQDSRPPMLPPDIAQLTHDGYLAPEHVEHARQLWRSLRQEVGVGAPFATSERLFHLTLLLAPHLDVRERRAFLETAIEILEDPGHRQVIRGALARDAVLAGDLGAADAWLAPMNPRATDLAMDTAYRYAAAMLATARGQDARVTELLGWRDTDVPLADADEVGCAILRANVLERQGRTQEAAAELTRALHDHGKAPLRYELARMAQLGPARATVAQVLGQHDAQERRQIQAGIDQMKLQLAGIESPTWHPVNLIGAIFLGFILSLVVTIPWSCGVVPSADIDPWLGPHAKTFCPAVCDGCTDPYSYLQFHTSSNGSESDHFYVYCNDPNGTVMSMHENWGQLMSARGTNEAYELPGGGFTLWLTSLPCWAPVGFFIWLAYRASTAGKRRAKARDVRERIAESERRLASIGT